jgi:hypothetical protein
MKKHSISSSILKKIKKEKIEQHSKLYFFAKFTLMLFGGIIFLLIGTIAAAVIFHFFHDLELLEIFSIERMIFFKALLLSFPIFWVIISILLGIFAGYFARNTKKGYKISYKIWFIGIILIQIFAGFTLEQSPLGEQLEHRMFRQINILGSREGMFQELWQNPEKGMLIGKIYKITEGKFILIDLKKKEWEVDFQEKDVQKKGTLAVSDKIRIIGKQIGATQFSAKKIFGIRFRSKETLSAPIIKKRREQHLRLKNQN